MEDSRPGSGGVSGIGQREVNLTREASLHGKGHPHPTWTRHVTPLGSHWPSAM